MHGISNRYSDIQAFTFCVSIEFVKSDAIFIHISFVRLWPSRSDDSGSDSHADLNNCANQHLHSNTNIALSDNVLKPLLMGKGSTVPMLVIFLGAIGGFILSGLSGMFSGAIVLSVGYTLMVHWAKSRSNRNPYFGHWVGIPKL